MGLFKRKKDLRLIDGHAYCYPKTQQQKQYVYYPVARSSLFEDYINILHHKKMGGALLIQPSILGFNHRYLLESLSHGRTATDMFFRGVANVPLNIHKDMIKQLTEGGIIGARLNLLHSGIPDLNSLEWKEFLKNINQAGWFLEIQIQGRYLPEILKPLLEKTHHLVIEHFALPETSKEFIVKDYDYLSELSEAHKDNLSITLTGPYRVFKNTDLKNSIGLCNLLVKLLISKLGGAQYLIWGSDWPFGHLAHNISYDDSIKWGNKWLGKDINLGITRLIKKTYHPKL